MSEVFSYAILGRGRWAGVISRVLVEEGRRTTNLENVRRGAAEPESDYCARICRELTRTSAQIAWLCVPPGSHIPVLIEAALSAGVHTLVEKPWFGSRSDGQRLNSLAREKRLQVGFDWEYCLIDEVERWRRELNSVTEMQFSGAFCVSRPDRLGISALQNLGSHLAAIHAYAVSKARISELRCEYDSENQRTVRLERHSQVLASLDFNGIREPLLPRLIRRFESSIAALDFPFDLTFAARVSETLAAYSHSTNLGEK